MIQLLPKIIILQLYRDRISEKNMVILSTLIAISTEIQYLSIGSQLYQSETLHPEQH